MSCFVPNDKKKYYLNKLNKFKYEEVSEDQCEILDIKLGRGAYGDVYVGKYNNETVAVKIIDAQFDVKSM